VNSTVNLDHLDAIATVVRAPSVVSVDMPIRNTQAVARNAAELEANAVRVLNNDQREALSFIGESLSRRGLALCGGAALALYLGHRRTNDLDLMGSGDFSTDGVESDLCHTGRPVKLLSDAQHGFRQAAFRVGNTKIESIRMDVDATAGHRITGNTLVPPYEEIVAMKMASAAYRGTKRDIVDVYYMLRAGHTANELVTRVTDRYPDRPGLSRTQIVSSVVNCTSKRTHRSDDIVDQVEPVPWGTMLRTVQRAFAAVDRPAP